MSRFRPTLMERLFDDQPDVSAEYAVRQLTIEQLKDSVARDLEALLNTRCGLDRDVLTPFKQCTRSVLSFGMTDFVGMSLANPADRDFICRAIERAIAEHEPRLRNVLVQLEAGTPSTNRLHFSIRALLVVEPAKEPVNFDALLQPTTQQYAVQCARRSPIGH